MPGQVLEGEHCGSSHKTDLKTWAGFSQGDRDGGSGYGVLEVRGGVDRGAAGFGITFRKLPCIVYLLLRNSHVPCQF